MAVATFDTLAAANTLEEAGFEKEQAKAAVAMVRDAVSESVATKTDIESLKADHGRLEEKINGLKDSNKILMAIGVAILATVVGGHFV